jgi:hypothetical protein
MANHGPSYGLSRELEKKVRIQSKVSYYGYNVILGLIFNQIDLLKMVEYAPTIVSINMILLKIRLMRRIAL